jgi:hypothetical protein
MSARRICTGLALAASLAGCGLFGGDRSERYDSTVTSAEDPYYPTSKNDDYVTYDPRYNDYAGYSQSVQQQTGQSIISTLFGLGGDKNNGGGGGGSGGPAGVGVNSYLWRATLDTVSFMPMASADPFGGVIITDWYSPPDAPNERFKVNIFILGRELRADGVRCTVFRQKRDPNGQWAEAPVDQATGTNIENAILTRARQMRLSTASK